MNFKIDRKLIIIAIVFVFLIVVCFLSQSYALDTNGSVFSNVQSLKSATNLKEGSIVYTKGYYTMNDGGGATYTIKKRYNGYKIDNLRELELKNNFIAVLKLSNEYYYNVRQLGVVAGINPKVNKSNNTKEPSDKDKEIAKNNTVIINSIIKRYSNRVTLFFPAGRYLLNNIDASGINSLSLEGVSNSFASVFNYKTSDVYSVLLFNTSNSTPVVKLNSSKGTNINISGLGIYGSFYRCSNGLKRETCEKDDSPVYGSKSSRFIGGDNKSKVISINNSSFVQWGTVIGNETVNLSNNSLTTHYSYATITVNVEKSRFTLNGIAISNVKKSTINNSSFNSNNYAFVFDGSSGNTTISHCRVEWSKVNGYYIRGNSSGAPTNITIDNNELDRSGMSLINISYQTNKPSNIKFIGNVLRRAGVDNGNERHFYVVGCKNCEFKYNYTKKQCAFDSYKCGGEFPKKVSYFKDCENTIVKYNDLTGGGSGSDVNVVINSGTTLTSTTLSRDNITK